MSKELLDELQFEKNKREILRQTQTQTQTQTQLTKAHKDIPKIQMVDTKKYAWEYELENYRKSKLRDKFYIFGSICGILALILTIFLNFEEIVNFLMKF